MSVSSGVPRGLDIDHLMFLVMVNDFVGVLDQFCLLFTVGTKIWSSTLQRADKHAAGTQQVNQMSES